MRKMYSRRKGNDVVNGKIMKHYLLNYLKTIFILLNLLQSSLARDFEFDVEPSLRIFNKNNEDERGTQTSELYPGASASEWNGRQSVMLEAVVGKLFNKSVVDIAKLYNEKLLEDSQINVRLQRSTNEWLFYLDESMILQGVPSKSDVGSSSLFIFIQFKNSEVKIPVKIEVVRDEALATIEDAVFELCAFNEPITAMAIKLEYADRMIDKTKRVNLLLSLSTFFNVAPRRFQFHYFPEDFSGDREFLTGKGNIVESPNAKTLVVSWTVGCSSEEDISGMELIESSSQDGSLAHYIGFDVLEWKVLNRISDHHKRLRREARNRGGSDKTASTPILGSEESVTLKSKGRTRVQLNLIRNTPMPAAPVMASKMMVHNVIKPSPTMVIPQKLEPTKVPEDPNQPPMEMFGLPFLGPKLCRYFEFRIPADTFYDYEDGDTRKLKLQMFDASTNTLVEEESAWPRFDSKDQVLYGVPPSDTKIEKINMLLMAEDSSGTSTTSEFSIDIDIKDEPSAKSHKITFYFTEEKKDVPANVFHSEFGRSLAVALAKKENNPGCLTILKSGYTKSGQRYVVWYDEFLNSDTLCFENDLIKMATLMIGDDPKDGKNKPDKNFAAKFKPNLKLRSVKLEFLGPCVPKTTLEPTTLTQTTEEATTEAEEYTEMPPIILPPPQTTIETTTANDLETSPEITETTSPPPAIVLRPQLTGRTLPKYTIDIGRSSSIKIPYGLFSDSSTAEMNLDLQLMTSNNNPIPTWLTLLENTHEILAIPTLNDFKAMTTHNSTHHKWVGGIVAVNKNHKMSDKISLEIFVPMNQQATTGYNHEFQVKISNFDIKDFTVENEQDVIKILADIFGDGENTEEIIMHELKSGSVIFSWHNATIGNLPKCPIEQIAKLSKKIFTQDNLFMESAAKKFEAAGYTITEARMERKNACLNNLVAPTTAETTEAAKTPSVNSAGSSMIIIAVVTVCLILLLIILLVKCKMAKSAKQKKKRQETLALTNKDSPSDHQKVSIKKGVPIIFQDEISPNQNGGSPSTDAEPLMNNSNNHSQHYKNNNGLNDTRIINESTIESTPLTQSPATPLIATRTPPPYHPR